MTRSGHGWLALLSCVHQLSLSCAVWAATAPDDHDAWLALGVVCINPCRCRAMLCCHLPPWRAGMSCCHVVLQGVDYARRAANRRAIWGDYEEEEQPEEWSGCVCAVEKSTLSTMGTMDGRSRSAGVVAYMVMPSSGVM